MAEFLENFNSFDTLLSYTVKDKVTEREVIFPYTQAELIRGGAFWCVPNFDEAEPPFTIRHGEYRITPLEENGNSKVKNISGPWGSIETNSTWNFY